jgi:hypothetical protein
LVPSTGHSAGVEIQRARSLGGTTLEAWKADLCGRRPLAPAAAAAGAGRPAGEEVRADFAALVRQVDLLHHRIGRRAARGEVPAPLIASHRAVLTGELSLEAARKRVAEAERRRDLAVGTAEAVRSWTDLSRARQAQLEAADAVAFAYVALGRDCAAHAFCPRGAESELEEVRRLRHSLDL